MAQTRLGRNDAYGVDGTFAFFNNLTFNTYWARTRTDGVAGGDDASHRAQIDYAGDRYGVQVERLAVGDAVQSGDRVRAPRRHAPSVRPGPVQPAAAGEQDGAQVLLDRVDRTHRERRRAARDARLA